MRSTIALALLFVAVTSSARADAPLWRFETHG
jgi:hypothetical protein